MSDFKRQFTGGEVGSSSDGSTASAVWTAAGFSSGDAALNSPSAPVRVGSPWIDDPASGLRADRVVARTISPRLYRITATYSVPSGGGGTPEDPNLNPLQKPAVFRWEPVNIVEPIEADAAGNPITNSAGQGFEQQVNKRFAAQRLIVTRNEPTFSVATALAFINTVNASPFGGAGKGRVFCENIMPTESFTSFSSFVNVGYTLLFMSDFVFGKTPHQPRILDQATMAIAKVTIGDITRDSLVTLVTSTGERPTGPVMMNGRGSPWDTTITYLNAAKEPQGRREGEPGPKWVYNVQKGVKIENTTARATFLNFVDTYPSSFFGGLGLPV